MLQNNTLHVSVLSGRISWFHKRQIPLVSHDNQVFFKMSRMICIIYVYTN